MEYLVYLYDYKYEVDDFDITVHLPACIESFQTTRIFPTVLKIDLDA